jgi:hypothetical protein
VVRVAKVVAQTTELEKKIEKRHTKFGLNIDAGNTSNLLKKRKIRISNYFIVNETELFLKYQSNYIKTNFFYLFFYF